jgi:hypothetical protein
LNIKGIKEWIKIKNTFYEEDISVFHPELFIIQEANIKEAKG